tara:strand:- start:2353 stop:3207 length:855 start_codon:yes stop_codon:yes gene_type:complete
MGLKDLRSNLDIHGGTTIPAGADPASFNGLPNSSQATGPLVGELDNDFDYYRDSGNNDSPFDSARGQGNYPSNDDHLVAMLERRSVSSTNTDPIGPQGVGKTNPMTYSPTPGGNGQGTLDENMNMPNGVNSLNNSQYGNGIFGDALNQGKTVNGEDLHVAMLQNQYTSNINPDANYGAGQPGSTYPTLNPSPSSPNTFQDINGNKGPQFDDFRNTAYNIGEESMNPNQLDTVSELGLTGDYTSTVNPSTVYNSNWPTPGRIATAYGQLDLDGGTPSKYQDSLPQ